MVNNNLVGGFNPSEKYDFVSWDDGIPNIWKNKKCSKPPTSHCVFFNGQTFFNLFLSSQKIEHLIVNMDWLCQLGLFCS